MPKRKKITEISAICKENFREQINYNYFIIKYKNFFLLITKNIKIIIIIFFSVFNIINKLIKY